MNESASRRGSGAPAARRTSESGSRPSVRAGAADASQAHRRRAAVTPSGTRWSSGRTCCSASRRSWSPGRTSPASVVLVIRYVIAAAVLLLVFARRRRLKGSAAAGGVAAVPADGAARLDAGPRLLLRRPRARCRGGDVRLLPAAVLGRAARTAACCTSTTERIVYAAMPVALGGLVLILAPSFAADAIAVVRGRAVAAARGRRELRSVPDHAQTADARGVQHLGRRRHVRCSTHSCFCRSDSGRRSARGTASPRRT